MKKRYKWTLLVLIPIFALYIGTKLSNWVEKWLESYRETHPANPMTKVPSRGSLSPRIIELIEKYKDNLSSITLAVVGV